MNEDKEEIGTRTGMQTRTERRVKGRASPGTYETIAGMGLKVGGRG